MLTVCLSVLLVGVGVGIGFGLPLLAVRRGERRDSERGYAAERLRHQAMVADYEATIAAYRRYVKDDPELSMTSR